MLRLNDKEFKEIINNIKDGEKLSIVYFDTNNYAIILEDKEDVIDCLETGYNSKYKAIERLVNIGYFKKMYYKEIKK